MSEANSDTAGTGVSDTSSGTDAGGDMDAGAFASAPEWLPDKFRVESEGRFDAPASFEKAMSSYTALESKIGASKESLKAEVMEEMKAGLPENPADYGLPDLENTKWDGIPEGVSVELSADDPMVQSAQGWAQKHGVSQEAFHELANLYIQQQINELPDVNGQMKALGDDAQGRIQRLEAKLAKNLPEEQYRGLVETLEVNASLVQALETLTTDMDGVPLDLEGANDSVTREDIMKLMDTDEYRNNDSQTHARVQKMWAQLAGSARQ